MDGSLTGSVHGLTLSTTPAELHRAVAESMALGTRRAVDLFIGHGIEIDRLVASGGTFGLGLSLPILGLGLSLPILGFGLVFAHSSRLAELLRVSFALSSSAGGRIHRDYAVSRVLIGA